VTLAAPPASEGTMLTIDIWSDVVCPWCYVGKRRLEKALETSGEKAEIRWHSFELDPSAPRSQPGNYAARLAKKYGKSVAQADQMLKQMTATAAADGLPFDFDKAQPGNTFDAHRLLHLAAELGKQNELKERLFKATFTDGAPIGDREALVKLAGDVGIDEERARATLLSDEFADAVRADEADAQQIGISGVPFFVFGGKCAVSGAQPPEVLVQVIKKTLAEQKPEVVAAGDSCTDDVCV
jgi:predicted DsbA family dithiol-disulfide isomerase